MIFEKIDFMGSGDPGEAVLTNKADFAAIPYTAQKIDSARIGGLDLPATAVLWASKMGVCKE